MAGPDDPSQHRHLPSAPRDVPVLACVVLLLAAAASVPTAVRAQEDDLRVARDVPRDTITYEQALRIAVRQSTAVRRALGSADLQGAEATQQAMEFLPDLQLSTGATRTFGRSFSQQQGEILSQTSDFLDVGGSASLELFNGFERWASLEQAQQQEQAGRLQVERARQDAAFQVVDRFATLLQNRELTRVAEQELETQEELLQQMQFG